MLMLLREYAKFFLNGGILGLLAWAMQLLLYRSFGGDASWKYAMASAATYLPLILINFQVQKRWIFERPGVFPRFVVANAAIMLLVSALSPICQVLFDLALAPPWGSRLGFAAAAVLGSIPSFLVKRTWVFGKSLRTTVPMR
jgi:putative flippase GtrA